VDGFVQSNEPHLVRQEITLKRLPRAFDGFTLAHLSDFHYEPHFSVVPIRKAVELVNGVRPDMTVLTGDFVTVPVFEREGFLRESAQTAIPCAALLAQIQGPKYAILGNHDAMADPALIVRSLEGKGIPVLRNRCLPIERNNGRMWLAGIDDLLRGRPRIDLTLSPTTPIKLLFCPWTCSYPGIPMEDKFGFRALVPHGCHRCRGGTRADFTRFKTLRYTQTSELERSAPRSG
jgi:predicted MPP superfamily phosphohydrolase